MYIYPLDTHSQTLIKSKNLSCHLCDTLEYFCQSTEHNEVGWLVLTSPDKVDNKKGWALEFKFPAEAWHKWPESFSICLERDPYLLIATELSWLESRLRISSCEWLNCNTNWIPSLTRCLLSKSGERMGILKLEWGCVIWPRGSRGHWAVKFDVSSVTRSSLSTPSRSGLHIYLPLLRRLTLIS